MNHFIKCLWALVVCSVLFSCPINAQETKPQKEEGKSQKGEEKPSKEEPENTVEVVAKRVEQTTAGPVDGYRALTANSSTKTNTPLRQLPQSVQVIPRSLITDQHNLSIAEAARNASGVQATNPLQTPAFDSTYIRGFPAEQWLDGIATYYNAGDRDSLTNVERIEVLKGPNAILYGGGTGAPLGGVINIISKLPTDKAFNQFGVTLGSHSYIQPQFDFNQPLSENGKSLFRMTGDYTSAGSFINVLDTDRYSLNPTLMFTNKKRTTLTVQGRLSDWQQQDYQGLPATGTILGPFALNRNLFVGPTNIPRSFSQVHSATTTLDHKFNAVWSANVQARIGETNFEEIAQNFVGGDGFAGNVPAVPPSSWSLLNLDLFQKQKEATWNANVLAEFNKGISKNKLLLGYDHSRLTDNGVMLADFNDLVNLGLVDLTNPIFPPYVAPANTPANTVVDGNNRYVTQGFYAQLQSTIRDRFHLLGGVRRTKLQINSFSPLLGRTDLTDTSKTLPRLGIVADLNKKLSAFASYSEGLKGNPFVFYVGTPKPEESKQKEAGLKFDLGNGFSGSAALFDIDRTGVPVFTGIASEAIGMQRSRGVETDLLWQPSKNWQVLGNYAHANPILTSAIPGGAPAGSQLNIVPRDSGRVWVNYKFSPGPLAGWSVGAGVYASSGAFVDLANSLRTNGYGTLDAKIAYENEKYLAALSIKNLTGEQYFVPFNYYGGRIAPGAPRGIYGQFVWKF